MKYIFSILLCLILQTGFSQIIKTVGISYTNGTPIYTPAKAGSALALDTTTWRYYTWNGSTWLSDGFRVQTISGCSAPAYTPTKFQSLVVINACNNAQGGPEIYKWSGSVWEKSGGTSYTAGTGIVISGGNVISNTGDLSATNELNSALTVTGGNLRLTDPGGSLDIAVSSIAPVQAVAAGTGISIAGTTTQTITNTSPNVVQVLSILGQTVSLSGGGGSIGIPIDSLFRKTNGAYPAKYISDNIYKNGTLGIGTTDTTGILSIRWPGNTKPVIRVPFADATTNSLNGFSFVPETQTDETKGSPRFDLYGTNFINQNLPFTTLPDFVWRLGSNIGPGGGRIVSSIPGIHFSFESRFHNTFIGGFSDRLTAEEHLEVQDTNGVSHRLYSFQNAFDGSVGDVGFNSDAFYFSRYNLGSHPWLQVNRFIKEFAFRDSMIILFDKNNLGGGIQQRNAANSAYLNLLFADNSDRVVVGGAGVTATYMPHGKLQMAGTGEIYNTSGRIINIGNSGSPTRLDINSYGSEVLKLRSVVGGSATWTHTVNSDNYVVTRPDGANIFQFYNNAATITSSSNKVGIGTDTRGRLTIQQISNTGQGGLMFVPTSGSEMYMQVNSSSQLAITSASGNERVLVAQDGSTGIGASPAASAKLTVTSTTQGFLPPRMTTTQRDAISSPATGLTLYCTDCTAFDLSTGVMVTWNGTTWKTNW
jgi:hypothetical protein